MTNIFSHTAALQTRFAVAAMAQAVWPSDDRDRKRAPLRSSRAGLCQA